MLGNLQTDNTWRFQFGDMHTVSLHLVGFRIHVQKDGIALQKDLEGGGRVMLEIVAPDSKSREGTVVNERREKKAQSRVTDAIGGQIQKLKRRTTSKRFCDFQRSIVNAIARQIEPLNGAVSNKSFAM
eukprot:TRINITY_DN887_c0_g1_i2.p1 TRINITY_DN887_c0_g1~~TRINITY_DN887_c0_g1_i2.p1  ORF type:complete len:128 (+),score=13.17 TRINITY_DN887_c0_g1_i2:59-442(+)